MSEVKLIFHNYGLTPNGEYELHDGTIFFMQGPNERGKTTFLNGIMSLMTVQDDKINPVTFGEKEGHIIGAPMIGADGETYTIRYDFDDKGKKKFVFLREDGSKIANIGDMRAVFNYTHFTVTDWWQMSLSEPGRKKQREFFINMLSQEEKDKLQEIESRVNEKTGANFVERKNLKSEVDVLEAQAKSHVFTEEERKILAAGPTIDSTLLTYKTQKEAAVKIINESAVGNEKLQSLKERMISNEENYNTLSANLNSDIEELERQLAVKKSQLKTAHDSFQTEQSQNAVILEELEKTVDVEAITQAQNLLVGTAENPGLNTRIENGERIKNAYTSILTRQEGYVKSAKELKDKKARLEELETMITADRQLKKDIVTNSTSIPARWGIEEDGVTFDGIPFRESDISLSKAARAIAELMIQINKAPIMIMGDAENLGYTVLAELKALAVEHNKIMIFAEHDRQSKDVHLVCYDELDVPEAAVQNKTSLF